MKSVTVVGSGIIGLTSAIILQESGFKVTMLAKERFDKTLSCKVGAIWFPFEIEPKAKATIWATLAYERYKMDVKDGNGVAFLPFLTSYNQDSNTDWTLQLPTGTVRTALQSELPNGIEMAHISIVPLAEPLLYLPYLFDKFTSDGGTFEVKEISSLEQLSSLNTLVVNCTGLGAKKLCNDDELHPMRGQILRCKKMKTISFADSSQKNALSYIINRSEDCVIGGTDYLDDWNTNSEKLDTNLILKRFNSFTNASENPEILEEIVGLRPRRTSVRFEFDVDYPNVFHNYGHGGAGFTVAWGCAIELAEILSKA